MSNRFWSLSTIVLVLTTPSLAQAQYAPVDTDKVAQAAAAKEKQIQLDARRVLIGTKFWVVPNTQAKERVRFYPVDASRGDEGFEVTEPAAFTVIDIFALGSKRLSARERAKIVFSDGVEAELEMGGNFSSRPEKRYMFDNQYSPGDGWQSPVIEYVLTVSPEELRNFEKREKAEYAARRDTRIGMTSKQVRASKWGSPNSINRTAGSFGVHEQWVYGNGMYLYFQNGILRSMQY